MLVWLLFYFKNMKIIDENGKERSAVSLKKIKHNIPDKVNGGYLQEEFVEAMIEGKHGTWKEWYHLPKFRQLNPGICV
jgi:hypothetical protein